MSPFLLLFFFRNLIPVFSFFSVRFLCLFLFLLLSFLYVRVVYVSMFTIQRTPLSRLPQQGEKRRVSSIATPCSSPSVLAVGDVLESIQKKRVAAHQVERLPLIHAVEEPTQVGAETLANAMQLRLPLTATRCVCVTGTPMSATKEGCTYVRMYV